MTTNNKDIELMVTEFHDKHSLLERSGISAAHDHVMRLVASMMTAVAGELEPLVDLDERIMRTHLIIEEVGETIRALASYRQYPRATDEDAVLLDGLCDVVYVVVGTAVKFGLPFSDAFVEVHKSNMTKTRAKKKDTRIRSKGESYEPPELLSIVRRRKEPDE